MLEVEDMLITWCGSLAVLLNKLWRTLFKVEKIEDNFEETIKRSLSTYAFFRATSLFTAC